MFGYLFGKTPVEAVQTQSVYQVGQLEVEVELNPLGGYRGQVGTLSVRHINQKVLKDWDDQDLQELAELSQLILHIQEQALVDNTLIFSRQELNEEFKLSFVPYPKCNWIEKLEGFVHAIFGAPLLKQTQVKAIADFYSKQFSQARTISTVDRAAKDKQDPFCRSTVLDKQTIAHVGDFTLLHDNCPKGRTSQDPHFLIIPTGDTGHCDGSSVAVDRRLAMLKIFQKATDYLQTEGYTNVLYLERNGKKLQGIQHKHQHVIGVQQFPQHILTKIFALARQLVAPVLGKLSQADLKARIQHYQTYQWN